MAQIQDGQPPATPYHGREARFRPVCAMEVFFCRNGHNYVHCGMGENEINEWDDLKNDQNIGLRDIDFAGLSAAFDGRFSIVRSDIRHDYGEQRNNMIVELNGIILNITFTPRGEKYRIISARLANRKERRLYHAQQQNS